MFELRELSGNLFKNKKDGVETRPDYRGEIKIDGVIHELSAWLKDGKQGKFMSLSAKPKGARKPSKQDTESAPF